MKSLESNDQATIFSLLKTLYRSHNGSGLDSDAWYEITKKIEDLNERYDHLILRPQPEIKLPVLIQPTSILAEQLRSVKDPLHSRAASSVEQFDFVFQLVKATRIPGVGAKVSAIIDVSLKQYGLCLGVDLAEYEEYLNSFSAEATIAAMDGVKYFYVMPPGSNHTFVFAYEPELELTARFSYQLWRMEFMGLQVAASSRRELYDLIAERLYEAWIKKPDSLKKSPLIWIEEYDLEFGNNFKSSHYTVWPKWKDSPTRTRPDTLYTSRDRHTTKIIEE